MKEELLKYLCCPNCRGELSLESCMMEESQIKEGTIICNTCSSKYAIRNFIPRFVGTADYAHAFSWEWTVFKKTQLDSYTGLDISDRDFGRAFNFPVEGLEGKIVLDAGCGMGRFAEIALNYGATCFCVDLTYAIDAAFDNLHHRDNIHFVQADLFRLPFKKEIFDVIYSLGVLHHTPDPPRAFQSLIPHLKRGAKITIRVYAKYNKPYIVVTEFYRKFTKRLPKRLLLYLSYIAVPLYYVHKIPIIGPFITRIVLPVSVRPPTHQWRVCNTFDLYSPYYAFHYDHYEVFQWFKQAGLQEIEVVHPEGGVCFIGTKG